MVGGDFVVVADADGRSRHRGRPGRARRHRLHHPRWPRPAPSRANGQVDEVGDVGPRLVMWQRDARSRLAYEAEVLGTTPGTRRARRSASTPGRDRPRAREQIAHGTGAAAYSGPNPLPIATSGSAGSA